MFEELDDRSRRFNDLRPLDAATSRRLEKVLKPYFIYSSNALEGSTLSLGDTVYILEERRLPGGKREEEYLEVVGQEDAYRYLVQAVDEKFELSEKLIREFHQLLTGKLDGAKYQSGQYKNRDNRVALDDGTAFPYVSHTETPVQVHNLVEWVRVERSRLHPVELAARFHYNFILIHPFLDGNGRTARILTNLLLMQDGYIPALFRAEARRRVYLDALRAVDVSVESSLLRPFAQSLNYFPFASYMEQELLWSVDRAFDVIEGRAGLTSEELIRKFSAVDGRAQNTVPQDDADRRRALDVAVEALAGSIERTILGITTKSNQVMKELEATITVQRFRAEPNDLGPQFGMPSLKGAFVVVGVRMNRRIDALAAMNVGPNACDFAIGAEPHRLLLACRTLNPAGGFNTALLNLATQSELWRETEIEQFILDHLAQFIEGVRLSSDSLSQ